MTELHILIRDCQKGKILAQRKLYELYAPEMLGVCYRYTKSVHDAEDVLQEGFMKVFANLGQFEGKGELGAWIRRIMVNTSINYLKKHAHYRMDMVFSEPGLHPVSQDSPDINLDAKELCSLIRQLPTGYQAVFNLHAVEGYSHVEIGTMLGISENTSRSQYMRARNLLCKWIEQEEIKKNETYARKRL
jgi:RNA polymerase sigma-70 factor (ECF subfamily)